MDHRSARLLFFSTLGVLAWSGCFMEGGGGYPLNMAGGAKGNTYFGKWEAGARFGGAFRIGSDRKRLTIGGGFRMFTFDSTVEDSTIECKVYMLPVTAMWRVWHNRYLSLLVDVEGGTAFRQFDYTNGADFTGSVLGGAGLRYYPWDDRSLFYLALLVRAGYVGEGIDSHVGGNVVLPIHLAVGIDLAR